MTEHHKYSVSLQCQMISWLVQLQRGRHTLGTTVKALAAMIILTQSRSTLMMQLN